MDFSISSKYNERDPAVIRLPFPESHNILTSFAKTNETSINIHDIHQHPLILVDTRCSNDITPIFCNGCLSRIPEGTPFYKCANDECNFVLHDWCTRLPAKIKGHIYEPRHTLILFTKLPDKYFLGLFYCVGCYIPCNGFAYCCVDCDFIMDVRCALLPKRVIHKSHPHHLLQETYKRDSKNHCRICLSGFTYGDIEASLSCEGCSFHLHIGCALLLPETIRHRYDKHPMTLSYGPIENHAGEYFCEVCEEELNPHISFYHCYDCVQSIHSACVPLVVPQSRPYIFGLIKDDGYYQKIKFGGVYDTKDHSHPLSLLEGTRRDGPQVPKKFEILYNVKVSPMQLCNSS